VPDFEQSRTGIDALDRIGADLDAAAQRIEQPEVSSPEPPRRRRVFARRIAVGVAVACCAVAAFALIRSGDDGLSTDDAVASILNSSANLTLPADDQYLYTHSKLVQLRDLSNITKPLPDAKRKHVFVPTTSEQFSWQSVDRPGRVVVDQQGALLTSAAQKAQYEKAAAAAGTTLGSALDTRTVTFRPARFRYTVAGKQLTRSELLAYPRDPATILANVRAGQGQPGDVVTWQLLVSTLQGASSPLPLELRNGMIAALGQLPGVKSLGLTRDPKGREAYGLQFEKGGVQRSVYFAKSDSALLYSEAKVIEPQLGQQASIPPGTVLERYTMLDQKVVDELPKAQR
jgi:hypothetical protein